MRVIDNSTGSTPLPSYRTHVSPPRDVHIPLAVLNANRFAQVRGTSEKSYGNLETMARNIATNGLLNPVTVYAVSKNQLTAWEDAVQTMFSTPHRSQRCKAFGNYYPIPIAGRRRLAAITQLREHGSDYWNEFQETPEECFRHLFPDELIPCRAITGSPQHALAIQLAENLSQLRPPQVVEVAAVEGLWRIHQDRANHPTRIAFAYELGISLLQLRHALRFSALPKSVRDIVPADGKRSRSGGRYYLSWSNALLLAKLQGTLERGKVYDHATQEFRQRTAGEVAETIEHHAHVAVTLPRAGFVSYLEPFFLEAIGQAELFDGEFALIAEEIVRFALDRRTQQLGADTTHFINQLTRVVRENDLKVMRGESTGRGVAHALRLSEELFDLIKQSISSDDLARLVAMAEDGRSLASGALAMLRELTESNRVTDY